LIPKYIWGSYHWYGFLKVYFVVCKTLNLGLAAMMLQVQGLRAATSSKIAEGQDYFQKVPSKFKL
jgi:hypothetical protein